MSQLSDSLASETGVYETLVYETQGHVATIQLNRPSNKNAFNKKMRLELAGALARADVDEQVRVMVLSGCGGAFSAGQDLSEGLNGGAEIVALVRDEYGPIIHRIDQSNKLVIAAVEGPCAGIGVALALACDFVVMSDNAYLYLAFIAIGLLPDGGATWQLVNQVGYKKAMEIIVSGEPFPAEQAIQLGLANRLSEKGEAFADAQAWAEKLAEKAPLAVAYSKQAAKAAQKMNFQETYAFEGALQATLVGSDDAKEGVAAFAEKRAPVFKGR